MALVVTTCPENREFAKSRGNSWKVSGKNLVRECLIGLHILGHAMEGFSCNWVFWSYAIRANFSVYSISCISVAYWWAEIGFWLSIVIRLTTAGLCNHSTFRGFRQHLPQLLLKCLQWRLHGVFLALHCLAGNLSWTYAADVVSYCFGLISFVVELS